MKNRFLWGMGMALCLMATVFTGCEKDKDKDKGGSGANAGNSSVYIGVVAFNREVYQLPITADLEKAKTFINQQENDQDFTAFAYSVSKGNLLFDAKGLPEFDKIYMLNFSDGTDNFSNNKWGEEGRRVGANYVYDTARHDILQRAGLNSYALGFGAQEADFREKMQKVVIGNGRYNSAVSSSDLQPTFNQIAQAIITSAKNVTLQTIPGFFNAKDGYKYFRFVFAAGSLKDTVLARMQGENTTGYTLTITKKGRYARFDDNVRGDVDKETGKVVLPLNNLKFVVDGEERQFNFVVEVAVEEGKYYSDVEEASAVEAVSKRLAVVLVLDCSSSMGGAFQPMKAAAIDFIETLERMAAAQGSGNSGGTNGSEASGTLEGWVEDRDTRVLLAQASVELLPTGRKLQTDKTGTFSFSDLEPGSYKLQVRKAGYAVYTSGNIAVESGRTVRHRVPLAKEQTDADYKETAFGMSMNMVYVEGGKFSMGATSEQGADAYDDEKPVHSVTLSGFYMGETEVTQAQWKAVMGTGLLDIIGSDDLHGLGDNYPMYVVSWADAVEFCTKLSRKTGKTYRLPTEAEWEYAARGGQKADGTKYAGSNTIGGVAWYEDNGDGQAHPVGSKRQNGLGLYDMSGNVAEWCWDWYGSYGSSSVTNPQGPSSGDYRVIRGGSWYNEVRICRVSARSGGELGKLYTNVGFRVVCER